MRMDLLAEAHRKGTPVIRGNQAYFLWEGAEAPLLLADFNGWEDGEPVELRQIKQDLWEYSIVLPDDAYIEYVYWKGGERIFDPLSRTKTPNGMGKFNHFFYMPKGKPNPHLQFRSGIARGTVTHQKVTSYFLARHQRTVHFYQPPVDYPTPLIVVYDGGDYLRRARLPEIVDQMIAQAMIEPVALAMLENGGPARGIEYTCSEATVGLLLSTVLPEARQTLNLVDIEQHPGVYGVMGASLGGLMALYTGLRVPQVFGKVFSQSGAFFTYGSIESIVWDLARQADPEKVKIWQDVGQFESLLENNRRMSDLLGERGYTFRYDEYPAGHNYPAWRNNVPKGLRYLFGTSQELNRRE